MLSDPALDGVHEGLAGLRTEPHGVRADLSSLAGRVYELATHGETRTR